MLVTAARSVRGLFAQDAECLRLRCMGAVGEKRFEGGTRKGKGGRGGCRATAVAASLTLALALGLLRRLLSDSASIVEHSSRKLGCFGKGVREKGVVGTVCLGRG